MENAYIESFNGKFRDECLNENWFMTLDQAREIVEEWRVEYNCFADTQPGWQEKRAEAQCRGAGLTGKVSLRLPPAYMGDHGFCIRPGRPGHRQP